MYLIDDLQYNWICSLLRKFIVSIFFWSSTCSVFHTCFCLLIISIFILNINAHKYTAAPWLHTSHNYQHNCIRVHIPIRTLRFPVSAARFETICTLLASLELSLAALFPCPFLFPLSLGLIPALVGALWPVAVLEG